MLNPCTIIIWLWSRPWGVARLLGLRGVPPRLIPRKGLGSTTTTIIIWQKGQFNIRDVLKLLSQFHMFVCISQFLIEIYQILK